MTEALTTLGAMFAFMLIPIWIPLIAVISGWVLDLVGAVKDTRHAASSRTTHPINLPQQGEPS